MITETTASNQATAIRNGEEIGLMSGKEVLEMLSDTAFQEAWDSLYAECSWATVFQSRDFVSTWYQLYTMNYLPIMVKASQQGKLTGLLTMARNCQGGIVGAGDAQAEYQVWLASHSKSEDFIQKALAEIRTAFPASEIMFKYLPANTHVEWIKTGSAWSKHCVLEEFRQPLLHLVEETLINELKKKDRRYKLNRLKKVGELTFKKIVDSQEFAAVFDELALQYDFRKSAMYNLTNFQNGALGKDFLFALFDKGVLHVTVLKLNEEIIASVISTRGKDKWVHFKGVNTHSLFYSKSSPGILHLLMLAKMLAEEGTDIFDLTPGADGFKDMLATNYGQVYKLTIGSAQKQLVVRLQAEIKTLIKQTASRLGIKRRELKKMKWKVYQLKNTVANGGKYRLVSTLQGVAEKVIGKRPSKRYQISSNELINFPAEVEIKKNDLRHLMMYDPYGKAPTKWEFHAEAMKRFEEGENCYSWASNERLLGCIWLNRAKPEAGEENKEPSKEDNNVSGNNLVLYGLYIHREGMGKLHYFLKTAAACVMLATGGQSVVVDALSRSHSQALEKAGFRLLN
jgi:CelD/BcsL family acetyltransferase involved in cellulose biosynthesis